jgi:AcrR family transcriptional regulator
MGGVPIRLANMPDMQAVAMRPQLNPLLLLRRAPEQGRSLDKIERIVTAARDLLATSGYVESVRSAAPIIEAAGVKRSTFYAYFESQETVMEYLSLRMLDSACDVVEEVAAHTYSSVDEIIETTVDAYAEYYRGAVVRELWLNQHVSGAARLAEREVNRYICQKLAQTYDATEPSPSDWGEIHILCAGQLVDSLMQLAFLRDPDGDAELLAEAKRACKLYVQDTRRTEQGGEKGTA